MKRLSILLLIIFLFSSCTQPDLLLEEQFHTEEYLPQYDMQNAFSGYRPVCESDTAIFFQPMDSNFLWYYDKETGSSGKLCSRPECMHIDRKCNAYVEGIAGINYYDNNIYFVQLNPADPNFKSLQYVTPDGASRATIQEYQSEIGGSNLQIRLHRGYIYRGLISNVVEDAQPSISVSITQEQLGSDAEPITILQKQATSDLRYYFQIKANKVYILLMYGYDVDLAAELYCYNIESRTLDLLYSNSDDPWYINDMWISDQVIYFATYKGNERRLEYYDLTTNTYTNSQPLYSLSSSPVLGDNIIITNEKAADTLERKYLITDFNGNVLREGILSPPQGVANTFAFQFFGSTSDYILYWWQIIDASHNMSSKIIAIPLDSTQDIIEMCQSGDRK